MAPRPLGVPDRSPIVAALAMLAGAVHLLLVQDHMEVSLGAGLFFLVLGVAQVAWGALLLRRHEPWMRLGGAAILLVAPTVLYVITRTLRAPWSTGAEEVDALGIITVATQALGALVLLTDSFRFRWPQRSAVVALGVLIAGGAYGSALAAENVAALSVPQSLHTHDNGEDHADHDGHAHGGAPLPGMRGVNVVGNVTYYGPDDAQGILDHCRGLGEADTDCWVHFINQYLEAYGAVAAFDLLEDLIERNEEARINGHAMAHEVGHHAYMAYGLDITLTLSQCSYKVFQGCLHGAIQAYFTDLAAQGLPLDTSAMGRLCSGATTGFESYSCNHGVGHGIMMHTNYDLHRSLDTCALMPTSIAQRACYGGVYMENVAGYLDSLDPDFVPHEHGDGPPTYWVDEDDPAFPCNEVKSRYADPCWIHQTSFILHFNGGNFAAASRVCDDHAGDAHLACYQGLGRLAGPYADRDPATMNRMCSYGDVDEQTVCTRAFVAGAISNANRLDAGRDLCPSVPSDLRAACHEEVGEQASFMLSGDALVAYCDAAPDAYRSACRQGAGLD